MSAQGFGVRAAIVIGAVGTAVLIAPRADADCRTTTVCYFQNGRQSCRSEQQCVARRAPVCTFVNRCTPVRVCSSTFQRTTCVYRDVCRSEKVCS